MDDQRPGVRPLTDDEVAHYRLNGWAKLAGLFPRWAIEGLLARAQMRMGAAPLTVSRIDADERTPNEYGWYARWDGCSNIDPWIHDLSHSRALATAASRLLGTPVRFYFDHFFVKVPARDGGSETPWHQDLPHHPVDRQGVITIWVPLVDCTPEMGTLRFLNGSHRAGLLGRYLNRRDGICLVDEHPWVLHEYTVSEPLTLRAGDATVHNLAIVHRAPANDSPSPRWVYVTQWMSVLTRYTGAPNHRTDGLGLRVDEPFEHPRFPPIAT